VFGKQYAFAQFLANAKMRASALRMPALPDCTWITTKTAASILPGSIPRIAFNGLIAPVDPPMTMTSLLAMFASMALTSPGTESCEADPSIYPAAFVGAPLLGGGIEGLMHRSRENQPNFRVPDTPSTGIARRTDSHC
jgi:hypothetical protein